MVISHSVILLYRGNNHTEAKRDNQKIVRDCNPRNTGGAAGCIAVNHLQNESSCQDFL